MSLSDDLIYTLVNGKRTITKTIFIKEFTKDNPQLNDLNELVMKVKNEDKKEMIERDISYLKYGLDGEENVSFELRNSFIPMLCLHDIRLEYEDYTAQFDFIIISKKFIYVLETKKLSGDIEITQDGDFIRIIKNRSGKIVKKEGMYSPISQNDRHVRILKEILTNNKFIKRMPVKSAVIVANPKTIISKKFCPKKIRDNVYKYDQVTNLLKREMDDRDNEFDVREKTLYAIADFLVKNNKPMKIDYINKYSLKDDDFVDENKKEEPKNKGFKEEKLEYASTGNSQKLYDALKKYRLEMSRKNNIKPYVIFNNSELDLLVSKKPETIEELLNIKGFGKWKAEHYGESIVNIIKGMN